MTNVRCDAEIEVTITGGRWGKRVDVVEAQNLDAHLTVQAFTEGRVSGYMPLGPAPKVNYKLVNPERDILAPEQLCPCPRNHEESA